MHVPARDAEGGVVAADGFGVGRLEQAVHVTAGVVEQLDLTDAELVNFSVFSFLCDLVNCLFGQIEVIVKVHELWHWLSFCVVSVLGEPSPDRSFVSGNLHPRRVARTPKRDSSPWRHLEGAEGLSDERLDLPDQARNLWKSTRS
jgi:hypothetical protein